MGYYTVSGLVEKTKRVYMKVLRVINSLGAGGAERSIAGNVPEHVKNGIDMEVLVLCSADTFFLSELKDKNIKVYHLGTDNNIYNPLLVLKLIRFINNYDLVHVHLFPSIYWVALAKIITFSKTKLVFTEHDTHNRRRNNWFLKKVDKILYRQYELIITISKGADYNLRKHLGEGYITRIIYNGVNLSKIREEGHFIDEYFRQKYDGKKVLIQVAGFRKQKDQDTLIKALTFLPDEFVAVFIGDGERMDECKALAKSLNLSDRVDFLGLRNQVGSFINLAYIVIMSSHWEGFGRSAVEGMALRKPIVASNVSGLSEVVRDAGLLFEVGDYKRLAELVIQLSSDNLFYNSIAEQCYLRANQYDITNMVKEYEEVYHTILTQK